MCRFGVAAWCLNVEQHEAIRTASSLGLEAIHLDFGRMGSEWKQWSPGDVGGLRKDAENYGVRIEAVALNVLEVISCAQSRHSIAGKRCRDIALMAIDSAEQLDAEFVYVPCFGENEIKTAEDLSRHAEFMHELCMRLNGSCLVLASENTLDGPKNLKLISEVGHPRMCILFDLYNPMIHGIDSCSLLKSIRPHMCESIHIKDGVGGVCGDVPIGEGDAKLHECASILMSSHFGGSVILENKYFHETERRIESDLRTARSLFVESRAL